MKPGLLTTEFWLTLIPLLVSWVAAFVNKLPSEYAGTATVILPAIYAFIRGWLKGKHLDNLADQIK